MLQTIAYAAIALSVAGAVCAVAAALAAEHFRRAEETVGAAGDPASPNSSRRQFALNYGIICMKLAAVFAFVGGAAYLAS